MAEITARENVLHFDGIGSFSQPCVIAGFCYSGVSTTTDFVSVSEYSGSAGNILFKQKSDAQKGTSPVGGLCIQADGIRVDTMANGYLTVFLR